MRKRKIPSSLQRSSSASVWERWCLCLQGEGEGMGWGLNPVSSPSMQGIHPIPSTLLLLSISPWHPTGDTAFASTAGTELPAFLKDQQRKSPTDKNPKLQHLQSLISQSPVSMLPAVLIIRPCGSAHIKLLVHLFLHHAAGVLLLASSPSST